MNTKLIAELGCNHQGEVSIAKRMIEEAEGLGLWGVKIQKRDVEAFSDGLKLLPRNQENSFGKNYYEHRKALEFSQEQVAELKTGAEDRGLAFLVSVFDTKSLELVDEIGVEYIKLPSQLYSSYHMCRLLKEKRRRRDFTVMSSVGMHTEQEVEEWQYKDLFDVLFYCRSIYPAEKNELDLEKMRPLRQSLKAHQCIGYSSHDRDGVAIPFAVALGAEYVERHFTLDKTWKGSDHSTVSSDPEDFKKIISDIYWVEDMMGSDLDDLCDKERRVRKTYRGF